MNSDTVLNSAEKHWGVLRTKEHHPEEKFGAELETSVATRPFQSEIDATTALVKELSTCHHNLVLAHTHPPKHPQTNTSATVTRNC
mmetsp:Transcript_99102/g.170683  ORF Transcript_99102/g.170683 Transcript_99102/m.170683 type:complete len:86 (-) Transcript_99102:1268-1525(-)